MNTMYEHNFTETLCYVWTLVSVFYQSIVCLHVVLLFFNLWLLQELYGLFGLQEEFWTRCLKCFKELPNSYRALIYISQQHRDARTLLLATAMYDVLDDSN